MTVLMYGVLLVCVALFVVVVVLRAIRFARMPIHLRWELYPIPHEEPHRVKHGGSYFEEADWWTKPRRRNLLGELRAMAPEILFMRGLWEFNRALWVRSYSFHFGLYLLIGTVTLVLLTAILDILHPGLLAGSLGRGLHWLYTVTGLSGLLLAVIGAGALLIRRLTAEDLKGYTTPGDIFNLCAFIVALGCLLAGYLLRGPESVTAVGFARGVLTFDTSVRLPGLLAVGVILSALLVAYIPCTHMAHFIGKYFTYHSVRWNDQPNTPGGRLERKIAEYLTYRPTWAAPHVGADGAKTWGEVAATIPKRKSK